MSVYRLCLVNSIRSWGGAEHWFLDVVRDLNERGVPADLVAQPDSELLGRARAAGVPCAAIPIRFDAAPWTLWKLARHFRRRGTTAVVANLIKDLKAAAVAARLAGVRLVFASRESDFPLERRLHYRWYLGRLAGGVLVNSRATLETTLASAPWLDRDRVHLLYKGVDLTRFFPTPGAPDRAHTVGCVGQLIERKGMRELMAAWSRLERRSLPRAPRLRIAGQGPLETELRAWRGTLAAPDRVELCGQVEDIAAFYAGCGVLVAPSHREGFGLAAAEASACGVPVVAARASSLPEIVRDGETGLLVDPSRPDEIADALASLLGDPERARALGRAGAVRVARRFDHERTLSELLRLTGGPSLPPRSTATNERPSRCRN